MKDMEKAVDILEKKYRRKQKSVLLVIMILMV